MKDQQQMNNPFLSVVIPSYNEKQNIERGVLDSVFEYLQKQPYEWELVLSDDGSSDGTVDVLRDFAQKDARIRLLTNDHRGKGPTVFAGMMNATGQYRLFTDFDQATPLNEVEKFFPYVQKGYDVVLGSREVVGSKREKEPFYRHLMGKGWNVFVQLLALPGIHDSQCGFKLFSAKAVEALFPKLYIYRPSKTRKDAYTGAFDVELLFLAKKYRFAMAEVAVHWRHVRTNRVSPVKDSLRMLIDLVKMRTADVLGKYPRG